MEPTTVTSNDKSPPVEGAASRAPLPERAQTICSQLGLDIARSPWLQDGMSAQQFLDVMIEQGELVDAVTFMACVLPKREAVWWGYLCAREVRGGELTAVDASALAAALEWVRDPTDPHRRAAKAAADATQYATPAGLVALATFFTGGSLAPPDVQAVPPAEHLTAQTIRSAVVAAAVIHAPQDADVHYRGYLQTGLDVAKRKLRWDQHDTEAVL